MTMIVFSILAFVPTLGVYGVEASGQVVSSSPPVGGEQQPNVLFIAVDDLRPLLGCYGNTAIRTPNIDRLAKRGTIFGRAYCQSPQCVSSRNSLLTGLRPKTSGVYSHEDSFDRKQHPDMVTLPECFKNHGYHTQSFGKIAHDGRDNPSWWSVPSSPGRKGEMWEVVNEEAVAQVPFEQRAQIPTLITIRTRKSPCVAIQSPEVPDQALYAGRMTAQAIRTIGELKDGPFFLAVGYRRPHLPFVAPKKYFDMYPSDAIVLPEHRHPPSDVPIWSIYNSITYARPDGIPPKFPATLKEALRFAGGEFRTYEGIPMSGPLSDPLQKEVWQAYMACVSYVDAQIGLLLQALDENGLSEKTIIVLWSDHGWHLGEHGTWAKMTLFEWATRVSLIVATPGQIQTNRNDSLVELIDIYPTLCELAYLPIPKHVEGTSFAPLLKEPDRPWKTAAFSTFPRFGHSMGHSMRTDRYRYTEWVGLEDNEVKGRELYDHKTDPLELVNIASSPDATVTVRQLSKQLKAGWRAAQPQDSLHSKKGS